MQYWAVITWSIFSKFLTIDTSYLARYGGYEKYFVSSNTWFIFCPVIAMLHVISKSTYIGSHHNSILLYIVYHWLFHNCFHWNIIPTSFFQISVAYWKFILMIKSSVSLNTRWTSSSSPLYFKSSVLQHSNIDHQYSSHQPFRLHFDQLGGENTW